MENIGSRRKSGKGRAAALVILILVASYGVWAVRRPLPPVEAALPSSATRVAVPADKSLVWPAGGQAAVGVAGTRILETHGKQAGAPTASTAKLITVLCVLQKRPLTPGQPGPTITLTQHDADIYNAYAAKDGSLVPVRPGEKITEYQMLETILLPSANNMADSLAIWAFGSLPVYSAYANGYVAALGLKDTHVGPDASGFDPGTKSSARDLVRLGETAMRNPVIAKIVSQETARGIPIAHKIKNVNFLLGTDGIIGIKTGNTDQAGGVFVGAARTKVNGRDVTLVTAAMQSHDIFTVLKDSHKLIRSAKINFQPVTVIKAGTVLGRYDLPWGGSVTAIADRTLTLDGWAGSDIPFTVRLKPLPSGAKAGQGVGSVTVRQSALNKQISIPVRLADTPATPSWGWRLTHPL